MAEKIERDEVGLRRTRERRALIKKSKRQEIAVRVRDFAKNDESNRAADTELRLQRYAKFRMWVEGGGDWPWEGSSDQGLPDMMTNVLSLEDTLHNAVMSNRPIANARAILKVYENNEDTIDDLLDTQVFIEQNGEKAVEETASAFVMDGNFVVYVPWIKEDRKIVMYRTFVKIKPEEVPRQKFEQIIKQEFFQLQATVIDEEGWDWEIVDEQGETFSIKFYTADDGEIEMVGTRKVRVYDGPKIIVKDYEDVLYPPRTANLQIPGPSNPGGASHVILVDHPTVDEIERLFEDGTYDLIDKKDLERIKTNSDDRFDDPAKQQKDVIRGQTQQKVPDDDSHKTLTRYLCFDLFDIDEDGINTDMMFWVLKEPELLLKAKPMTEMYPSEPPRRPLAEAQLIPDKGCREGIGLLEMMEPLHDFKKQIFDQVVDAGTLGNAPFFFYRPTSAIKPEVMRPYPGDGIPLTDPKNDVFFPNIGAGQAQSFGLNMMTMADAMTEKLTVQGDLQLGRVPIGRSAALRTTQNLQSLMQAGEARPERILRRFLMGWIEIFKQIHELNQHFLPEQKKFRIIGIREPTDDPYREVETSKDIAGRFQFDFSVNVLNASKIAIQDALERIMGVYISEIPIQLGITTPDGVFRMLRDWGKAHGQEPEKYISKPSPDALLAPITAEMAMTQLIFAQLPQGIPEEGAQNHLDKLKQFTQTDEIFGQLNTPGKLDLFKVYLRSVQERIKTENMAQAAGPLGGSPEGGPPGAAGPPPNLGPPQISGGAELLDETLPGAGGGGNAGGLQ